MGLKECCQVRMAESLHEGGHGDGEVILKVRLTLGDMNVRRVITF